MSNDNFKILNVGRNNFKIENEYYSKVIVLDCKRLVSDNLEVLSKEYIYIKKIDNDYLIVGNVVTSSCNESKIKYGIIKLKRDKHDKIIPCKEQFISPMIYDRIAIGNDDTAIACYDGSYTFLELNRESKYFGQPLIPAILSHCSHFDLKYKGFVECQIGFTGKNLYLPRLYIPVDKISTEDLLTKQQVLEKINSIEGNQKIKKIGTK